jgi:SAM-dependent methyltransferase
MTAAAPRSTFRDPAGSLRLEDSVAVRTIHPDARVSVLEFLDSPFCRRLQERGDLIAATIQEAPGSPAGLRLLHPRIPIPTYPWEWTPSQWAAAANLTLTLGEEALAEGWILKDATPHNILFVGSRPILVDILSFERRDPASSVWLAYGQYVRTFLLPLVMNRLLHWPLTLSLFKRDGFEPLDLYRALTWPQRLSRAALWPITLPAWLEKKQAAAAPLPKPATAKDPELALHLLRKTMRDLRRRTQRAVPPASASEWSEYTGSLTHYTPEQVDRKNAWLSEQLAHIRPARVLDVGANTGEYSLLAASFGAQVVALERDEAAAERLFQTTVSHAHNARLAPTIQTPQTIQTIHADLARPTPAVGWDNSESTALLPRLEGQFDLVLMLAVIHHLLLLEQIPLPDILALARRLTSRFLVVEWVPASDPMYQSLMRGRDALYGAIHESHLLAACDDRFTMLNRLTLENGRILLLFEKLEPSPLQR